MSSGSSPSDREQPTDSNDAETADNSRRPFVEPELRRETDLIRGTGDRHFFEATES